MQIILQALKTTSADLGPERETRETEGRGPATKAALSDQVFPIKPMAEDGGEEEAGEVEAKAVEEVGAIKKEDEVNLQDATHTDIYLQFSHLD